jgi:hypothetical protein
MRKKNEKGKRKRKKRKKKGKGKTTSLLSAHFRIYKTVNSFVT